MRTFYINPNYILAMWLVQSLAVGIAFLVMRSLDNGVEWLIELAPKMGFIISGLICLFLVLTWITHKLSRVEISNTSICSHTIWGFRVSLNWDEISEMTIKDMGGIQYLKLSKEGGYFGIYIPLFLEHLDEFLQQVSALHYRGGDIAGLLESHDLSEII